MKTTLHTVVLLHFFPFLPSPISPPPPSPDVACNSGGRFNQLGNFKVVQEILFPVWLGVIPPIFFVLEVRKQFKRVSEYIRLHKSGQC